jgi:hypothetical protein
MGRSSDHDVKISVIMVDGGFRDHIFGVESFAKQNFPPQDFEILWVDFYDKIHPRLRNFPQVKVMPLNQKGMYHSSRCFNAGIQEARGEILVIPDADVLVEEDFLSTVYEEHLKSPDLVLYFYRLIQEKGLSRSDDFSFEYIKRTCKLTAASLENYGGCVTVRKKWLIEIGGYEMHRAFASGAHANGKDVYTRLKNLGLYIKWHPRKFLYHPWHPGTAYVWADQKRVKWQLEIVKYRAVNQMTTAFEGLAGPSSVPYSVPPPPLGDPDNVIV